MAASGWYGPQMWTHKASSVFGFEEFFGDHTLRDLWVPVLTVAVFVGHIPAWYVDFEHWK